MNNKILGVLLIRPFLFLWLAEVFSQISMNMLNFILIIVAFKIANSNASVSGLVLSFTLPAIFLGLFAGVYVDRWNKKKVLFITNIARAILLLLLAVLPTNLVLLYGFTFALAAITQFFIPAEIPMIPVLVKKEMLLSANALFGIGVYGSALLGYALSGPFFILFGQNTVFFILGIFFFVAAGFIMLIKTDEINQTRIKKDAKKIVGTMKDELKVAFSLITKTKRIYYSLFLLAFSQIIVLTLAVVGPGFARQILGIDVDQFPLVFATPAAFGMVVGGIIIGSFFHGFSRQKCVQIGIIVSGLAIIALPYGSKVTSREIVQAVNLYLPHIVTISILHIMVFLSFILGFANALVFVPANTVLQEETSDELRGKIYGALSALLGICSIFPIAIVGPLADVYGIGRVLSGIGALLLALSFIRLVIFRKNHI